MTQPKEYLIGVLWHFYVDQKELKAFLKSLRNSYLDEPAVNVYRLKNKQNKESPESIR